MPFTHSRTLADPTDRSIVAMNVDTPYSYAWLDLRDGPVELTMPPVPAGRYMAAQLFDLYTYIVGYVSPRTTGRGGGTYLVVGPDGGDSDAAGRPVFHCPTQLCLVLVRTELFDDADMVNVAALQDGVHVRAPGPEGASPLIPIEPVDVRAAPTARFLEVLDWMLRLMPVLPEDVVVRDHIRQLRAAPAAMSGDVTAGLADGMADVIARTSTVRSSAEIFGSRQMLQADPLARCWCLPRDPGQCGRGVPRCGVPRRRRRAALRRHPSLLHPLRAGRASARRRVLVDHRVRR